MARICNNITDTIGNTPLVKLNRLISNSTVLAKLESFNPSSLVKGRIGNAMIVDAEKSGLLDKDTVIIEPTSGNTGIALALVSAAKEYKRVLTMHESMSIKRRKILSQLGAELVLAPAEKGMKGGIEQAEKLKEKYDKAFIPQQYNNPSNPEVHRNTTAKEIWNDTDGKVDILVSGIDTGGTIT